MTLHNRFVGEIREPIQSRDRIIVDVSELAMRLLLTDTVVLKTARLLEIRHLARVFGVEGLMLLFEAGKLRLTCEAFSLAYRQPHGTSDVSDFHFQTVYAKDQDTYLRNALSNVSSMGFRGAGSLAIAVKRNIEAAPGEPTAQVIREHLQRHLTSDWSLLARGVASTVARDCNVSVEASALDMQIHQLPTEGFRIRTNLTSKHQIPEDKARLAVGRGVLSAGALYERLDEMNRHNAIAAVTDGDLSFLDGYFHLLEQELSPNRGVDQFRRVVELTGLPRFDNETKLNAAKLIEVSRSAECAEFRQWLSRSSALSDDAIRELFCSLQARFGRLVSGGPGRVVRWVASTGVGLVPGAGTVLGAVSGALDSFVVDALLKPRGPVIFLGAMYPSIVAK